MTFLVPFVTHYLVIKVHAFKSDKDQSTAKELGILSAIKMPTHWRKSSVTYSAFCVSTC